jgi:hypothetical protein
MEQARESLAARREEEKRRETAATNMQRKQPRYTVSEDQTNPLQRHKAQLVALRGSRCRKLRRSQFLAEAIGGERSSKENSNNHMPPTQSTSLPTTWGREDTITPPARRLIKAACVRCRKRKIRCSGDPENGSGCLNCRQAGVEPAHCLFHEVESDVVHDPVNNSTVQKPLQQRYDTMRGHILQPNPYAQVDPPGARPSGARQPGQMFMSPAMQNSLLSNGTGGSPHFNLTPSPAQTGRESDAPLHIAPLPYTTDDTRGAPVAPMYAVPVYPPTSPNGTPPLHALYPQNPYLYPGVIYAQPPHHPQQ